ncbi:MAG: hypothetical protein J6X43_08060, partial [Bacteroidales bacterium]|nr:hypothetical protein [Bacteroidales bacterium]
MNVFGKFCVALVFGCSLITSISFGQYYSWGTEPFRVQWRQIKTEQYQLIYDKDSDNFKYYSQYGISLLNNGDSEKAAHILEIALEKSEIKNVILVKTKYSNANESEKNNKVLIDDQNLNVNNSNDWKSAKSSKSSKDSKNSNGSNSSSQSSKS